MTIRSADYLPRKINQHVPDMTYSADVSIHGPTVVNFGAPAVADPDGILDGVTVGTTAKTFTSSDWETAFNGLAADTGELDAPYGRNLTYVGNASTDQVVTVTGRDYLGQVMVENKTLNGTTTVNGTKCFKYIDKVETTVGTGGSTMDLGWGDVLGLPYKAVNVLTEEADDAREATLGTFVSGVETDPQTATTGDPRGSYNPQTTLDGSVVITGTFLFDEKNLHGVAHYSG